MSEAKIQAVTLPWLGMLICEGSETRHFLQGQLSCDTQKTQPGHWTWGGYLTPKGRLLATFVAVVFTDERIGLVMERRLIPMTIKKLQMYRLRAQVQLSEDSQAWVGWQDSAATQADGVLTASPDGASKLCLGEGLVLACATAGNDDEPSRAAWLVTCARQGLPWLTAPLQDRLTAHMVSLDLAGGIDFDKGCYVGQEIVIRSHHRGQIKKRAFVVTAPGTAPDEGAEVLSEIHAGQSAGQIIYASQSSENFVGLATIRKDATAGRLELEDGREISASVPPYGLIDPKFEGD